MRITIDTEDLKKLRISPVSLKKIIDKGAVPKADLYEKIPPVVMEKILNTSRVRLQHLTRTGKFPPREGEKNFRYYRLSKFAKTYWKLLFGSDVDQDIKKQKYIKLEIENKERAKDLISRSAAEARNVDLLRSVKRMFIYVAKTAAPVLLGCTNARQAEQVLMDRYKDMFELFDRETNRVEWNNAKEK